MDLLAKINLKSVLKIAGLAIIAIIVIWAAISLIGAALMSTVSRKAVSNISAISGPSSASFSFNGVKQESAAYDMDGSAGLSIRNVAPTMISGDYYPAGDQAEEFEISHYNASIETRNLDKTCQTIAGLKKLDYVIFENSTQRDRSCDYYFKAKRENASEVLALISSLDPKELTENTKTIKKLVDDFTSEIEILQNKLKSIDETLNKALAAYDEVTLLATSVRDAESLSRIIDSKINVIERLTQERININSQLERIERSKSDQLDRLEYTYFQVNVYENKYIDGENLKTSWQNSLKSFVRNINNFVQDITINLVAAIFIGIQYILYFFILLFVAKYIWRLSKRIWTR